jgi:hypothetical protein
LGGFARGGREESRRGVGVAALDEKRRFAGKEFFSNRPGLSPVG